MKLKLFTLLLLIVLPWIAHTQVVSKDLKQDTVSTCYQTREDKQLFVVLEHKEYDCQRLQLQKDTLISTLELSLFTVGKQLEFTKLQNDQLISKTGKLQEANMDLTLQNGKLKSNNKALTTIVIVETVLLTLLIIK